MVDFAADIDAVLPQLRTPQPLRSGTLVRLVGMTRLSVLVAKWSAAMATASKPRSLDLTTKFYF